MRNALAVLAAPVILLLVWWALAERPIDPPFTGNVDPPDSGATLPVTAQLPIAAGPAESIASTPGIREATAAGLDVVVAVVDELTGGPVPNLAIAVEGPRGEVEVSTGAGGEAVFDGLAPGAHTVAIHDPFWLLTDGASLSLRSDGSSPARHTVLVVAGARLEGSVVDQARMPVEGALVRTIVGGLGQDVFGPRAALQPHPLRPEGERRAITDASGVFTIDGIPPRWIGGLWVSHEAHAVTFASARVGAPLSTTQLPAIVLSSGAALDVVVTDAAGSAVADAYITCRAPGPEDAMSPVRSDANGCARIERVPPGKRRITVHSPDHALTGVDVVAKEHTTTRVEVVLTEGHRLRGRVVDADGAPIAAARVDATVEESKRRRVDYGPVVGRRIETDQEGRFELPGLGAGAVTLSVEHEDHAPARPKVTVPGPEVTITLRGRQVLTGRVQHADGSPVTDYELRLLVAGIWDDAGRIRHEAGRFAVEAREQGPWELLASTDEAFSSCRVETSHFADAEPAELVLVLQPRRTIAGTVLDAADGLPVVGARIEARPPEGGRDDFVRRIQAALMGPSATTAVGSSDSRGEFRLGLVCEGPVQLTVSAAGYRTAEQEVALPDTFVPLRPVLLQRLDRLRGLVLWADGAPAANAKVYAFTKRSKVPFAEASADAEGRFELEVAPDVDRIWAVVRQSEAGGLATAAVTVRPARRVAPLEIRMQRPDSRLSGLVLRSGRPVAGAEVRAIYAPPDFEAPALLWPGVRTTTDLQGRFELLDLPRGDYRLSVSDDLGTIRQSLALEATADLELQMR